MDRRRRHWAFSGAVAVGTHLAVIAGGFLGASPHYQRVQGRPGVRDLSEVTIDFDLAPPVEVAPAPPVTLVQPHATIHRGRALHHAPSVEATPPVEAPPGPNPLEPPPFVASTENDEAPAAGAGQASAPVLAAAAAPLPAATEPISISGGEAGYLRTYESYPSLPHSLWVVGRVYSVLAQVCVSARGEVSDVNIKHGAAPELDRAVMVAMRSWRYRPRMVEGAPRPFCHLMKLDFSLR
jgi:TonB family protein